MQKIKRQDNHVIGLTESHIKVIDAISKGSKPLVIVKGPQKSGKHVAIYLGIHEFQKNRHNQEFFLFSRNHTISKSIMVRMGRFLKPMLKGDLDFDSITSFKWRNNHNRLMSLPKTEHYLRGIMYDLAWFDNMTNSTEDREFLSKLAVNRAYNLDFKIILSMYDSPSNNQLIEDLGEVSQYMELIEMVESDDYTHNYQVM
jgi:hypothetical protein